MRLFPAPPAGAPPEPEFSSLISVMQELNEPPVVVGTSWFVDLFRSHIKPLAGDGRRGPPPPPPAPTHAATSSPRACSRAPPPHLQLERSCSASWEEFEALGDLEEVALNDAEQLRSN